MKITGQDVYGKIPVKPAAPLVTSPPLTMTLRLKGDYLAIATLGMAEIIRIVIVNGGEVTNGAAGLTGILPYQVLQ